MIVVGIESTCDETSVAIVEDGYKVLSCCTKSQIDIHTQFGGVVPELAARYHIEVIDSLFEKSLEEAGITRKDIDLIACAKGPGLVGTLLVGIHFARGLSYALQKPLVGVNHVEAHLYASMMQGPIDKLPFPSLGVVLSGSHTSLVLINGLHDYELLGQTVDDAVGEAFDKVAKMLDLPYPGGPEVEKLALKCKEPSLTFSRPRVKKSDLDFSFSGLKTRVLYALRDNPSINRASLAYAFQEVAFEDIIKKTEKAGNRYGVHDLFFGGGVTQNNRLREMAKKNLSFPLHFPPLLYCLDNGAMIGGLGFHIYEKTEKNELFSLQVQTKIPFSSRKVTPPSL